MKRRSIKAPFVSVFVRDARPKDRSSIDDLIRYLDWIHAEAWPDAHVLPTGASPRGDDFLEKALNDGGQKIVVAEVDGQVVAYVHLLIRAKPAESGETEQRYAEIASVAVDLFHQRIGIGRRVIECALGWATSMGVLDQRITAPSFNTGARALYQRMGFKPSATILRRRKTA